MWPLYILRFVQRLSLSFWIGEMLFFIIIFAPRVFSVLEKPEAAKLQAAIFPAYYLAGVIAAVLLLASTGILQAFFHQGQLSQTRLRLALACICMAGAVFAYSRWSITPRITELQPALYVDGGPSSEVRAQFDTLHRLSVQLNGGALLCLLALLVLL